MINELDLVRDHMAGVAASDEDLVLARSLLEAAIASEVDDDGPDRADRRAPDRRRRAARRNRWLVGAAAVVAASALLILQGVPSSQDRPPVAAAAQIRHLARAIRPPVAPRAGQWSTNTMQGVLSADVDAVGGKPTPDTQASIPISFEVWSNSTGTTCTSQTFGTAGFASPADAQAWHAIGLIDAPKNQPVTGCAAGVEATTGAGGMAAIDVGDLTHDAGTLATELQAGSTHIPVVDGAATGDPAAEAGFVRLTDLLVGPTTGTWVGFGQEMLQTLALLPGVISQGTVTAHSGHRGLGFSTKTVVLHTPAPERWRMGRHPRRSSSIRRRECYSRPGTSPSRSWRGQLRISSAVPRRRCTPTVSVTGSQPSGSTRSGRQVLSGKPPSRPGSTRSI